MRSPIALSISVLNADIANLRKSLTAVSPYADSFHVDIMDGTMTPMISFGTWMIPILKEIVDTPLEIHLYVRNIEKLTTEVLDMEVTRVLVNHEVMSKIIDNCSAVEKKRIGMYILPTDNIETIEIDILKNVPIVNIVTVDSLQGGQLISWTLVERTKWLGKVRQSHNFDFNISIDGGISEDILEKILRYPVDQLIVGSAIFASENPSNSASKLRNKLTSLQ